MVLVEVSLALNWHNGVQDFVKIRNGKVSINKIFQELNIL